MFLLETIFSAALLLIGVILFSVLVMAHVFRKKVGHDILGWHDCEIEGNDGCSNIGTCKYCGKKCLQDSQGNWF